MASAMPSAEEDHVIFGSGLTPDRTSVNSPIVAPETLEQKSSTALKERVKPRCVEITLITPSVPRKELNIVNPALPEFLDQLSIRNMRVGGSRVGLDFTRRGERTFCNVVDIEGDKLLVNVAFKKR